jgi:siroheme synthase-like protein
MHSYYPIFLNLEGKRSVVIGGGPVAEGKIARLRESGSQITVISPEVTPAIRHAAQQRSVEWLDREYQPGDLNGVFIAIAATNERSVNQQIFEEAERRGVLLNVVDDPVHCGFIAPSIIERGPVTLAISTGGASPALARKLRESLTDSPELKWADLADVVVRARNHLKANKVSVDPQRWQCCLTPELLDLVETGREADALESLLAGLTGEHSAELCDSVGHCQPKGCDQKVKALAAMLE